MEASAAHAAQPCAPRNRNGCKVVQLCGLLKMAGEGGLVGWEGQIRGHCWLCERSAGMLKKRVASIQTRPHRTRFKPGAPGPYDHVTYYAG